MNRLPPPNSAAATRSFFSRLLCPKVLLLLSLGYGVLLVTLLGGLVYLRPAVLQTMGTADETQNWEDWRTAAGSNPEQQGGVARKVPLSTEPPALVLMRDHFAMVVSASILFSAVLYVLFVVLIGGMLFGSSSSTSANETSGSGPSPLT